MRTFAKVLVLVVSTLSLAAQTTQPVVQTTPMTQGTVLSLEDQMKQWPTSFDGVNSMGPYKWTDGPSYLSTHDKTFLVNGVPGQQWVCRMYNQNGMHTGKLFAGAGKMLCNIGWGANTPASTEVSKDSGYEVLVMDQTKYANYFPQSWLPSNSAAAFRNGVDFKTRVCRASYQNGVHIGKEWEGSCLVGWGGKEYVIPAATGYEVLDLGFAKTQWQATLPPTVIVDTLTGQPSTVNIGTGGNLNLTQPQPQPNLNIPVVDATLKTMRNRVLIQNGAYYMAAGPYETGPQWYWFHTAGTARSMRPAGTKLQVCTPSMTNNDIPDQMAHLWFRREDETSQPGWFYIKFLDTELCVDNGGVRGANLTLVPCNPYTSGKSQRWTLVDRMLVANFNDGGAINAPAAALLGIGGGSIEKVCMTSENGFLMTQLCSAGYWITSMSVTPLWSFHDDKLDGKAQ
jgi:hypothetical protein